MDARASDQHIQPLNAQEFKAEIRGEESRVARTMRDGSVVIDHDCSSLKFTLFPFGAGHRDMSAVSILGMDVESNG